MGISIDSLAPGDRVFIDPRHGGVSPRLRGAAGTVVAVNGETVCVVWRRGEQSSTVLVESEAVLPDRRRPERRMG